MSFIIPAVATALSLGINYAGQNSRNKAIRDAKKKAFASLRSAYYSDAEIKAESDLVADMFNSEITNQANTVAYTGRNILNKGAFKGAALSKLGGQKAGAIAETVRNAKNFNKRIRMRMGEIETQMIEPGIDPDELGAAGLAGFQAGAAFEDAAFYREKVSSIEDKLNNAGVTPYEALDKAKNAVSQTKINNIDMKYIGLPSFMKNRNSWQIFTP